MVVKSTRQSALLLLLGDQGGCGSHAVKLTHSNCYYQLFQALLYHKTACCCCWTASPVLPRELPDSVWHDGEQLPKPAAAMQGRDCSFKCIWTHESDQKAALIDAVAPCHVAKLGQVLLKLLLAAAAAGLQGSGFARFCLVNTATSC